MCAFEEEINYKKNPKKPHMIKVLFSGRYFSDKLNETMEIVFLLQCNLYRKYCQLTFLDKHFFARRVITNQPHLNYTIWDGENNQQRKL